jgi:hypothetical protein
MQRRPAGSGQRATTWAFKPAAVNQASSSLSVMDVAGVISIMFTPYRLPMTENALAATIVPQPVDVRPALFGPATDSELRP